ncbi:MAG: NAD-dependent epimerase/dehydratase family protein [Leptospira sp.]|nr:NAD-dependent epimerase/dehydratase family protein [Leptospira sp.]
MKVLITGGAGFIGSNLIKKIRKSQPRWEILATDIRQLPPDFLSDDKRNQKRFKSVVLDICDREEVVRIAKDFKPDSVVHLASILNPPPGMTEEKQREIDIEGTRNTIDAAIISKAKQIVITSSGAAYGYHKDNPKWIKESHPTRGHDSFAYSRHKREIEEMLSRYRETNPKLNQLILRPGTILGRTVNNLITDLFQKATVLGVWGSDSPFVFIWDEDVIDIIEYGIDKKKSGIYNLAGDGSVAMPDIAKILEKPFTPLPAFLLKFVLSILNPLQLSQYGPDQIDFLRYRPVLDNAALKNEFGYTPRYSSLEAFYEFLKAKGVRYDEIL